MLAIAVLATELKLLDDDNFKVVAAKERDKRENRQKTLSSE